MKQECSQTSSYSKAYPQEASLEANMTRPESSETEASETETSKIEFSETEASEMESTEKEIKSLEPGLYLVATPIGNIADFSPRALEVLNSASIVAAEDTRVSSLLLSQVGISRSLLSYHSYNTTKRDPELLDALAKGLSVAVISDAGLPLISDPGGSLVQQAVEAGHEVTVIPGPSAGITALCGSGLDASRYLFYGFLPKKQGKRQSTLEELLESPYTLIFYEAPQRLPDTLQLLQELAPERKVVVARELTKRYETYYRGTAQELAKQIKDPPKGECVLLLEGLESYHERHPQTSEMNTKALEVLRLVLERGLSVKDATRLLQLIDPSLDKNAIYQKALEIREGNYA